MSYTDIITPEYAYDTYIPSVTLFTHAANNVVLFDKRHNQNAPVSKTDLQIKQLKEEFKLAKDEQGVIGKAWNGIKNLFNIEYSSSKVEKVLNSLNSNSTDEEINNVKNMIAKYRSKQDLAVDTVATTGATIVAGVAGTKVGAMIGSILCPGAGTIVGGILGGISGAIVGAVAKVGICQLENMTDNVDNNAWYNDKNIGKQFTSGALFGATAMLFGGIAKKVSGICKTALGITKQGIILAENGTANVAKTVARTALTEGASGAAASAVIADGEYLIKCATDENTEFSWGDLVQTTGISAVTGGLMSAGFGAITGYRNAKTYNSKLTSEIHTQNKSSNSTQSQRQDVKTQTLTEIEKGSCKIKTTKSPKGNLISEETYIYDKSGNITKYIQKQGGMTTEYNYATKELSILDVKLADGTNSTLKYNVYKINPNEICFTQRSIGENYKDIVDSFKRTGWQGKPVDIIRTKFGQYISMDNKRIAAAREAGVDAHVIIHDIEEPLTFGKQLQFQIRHPETNEIIAKPKTWGEAIYNRLFQNGLIITKPKTIIGIIWNKIFNLNSGFIDFNKAHHIPLTLPDLELNQRKLELFNLYKEGKKPYSSSLL